MTINLMEEKLIIYLAKEYKALTYRLSIIYDIHSNYIEG